jgi:DNA-binding PadR family transcriptional regulator
LLKHGILGLLNYGSMTGYEINKAFKDSLSYFWNAQTSQIYRELQTIKSNGWATDEVVEQIGKPDKKIFTITESGRAELNRWLVEDNTEFVTRIPILMKTFFRGERSLEENIAYFSQLEDMGIDFLTQFQNEPPKVEDYSKRLKDPMNAVFWEMTVEFGKMYIQMYFSWVNQCKMRLEGIKNGSAQETPERQPN